jgi:hypothetical protein
MKDVILSYGDFQKIKFCLFDDHPENFQKRKKGFIDSGESGRILPYCLRLMHIMNKRRDKIIEKGIYDISIFLDVMCNTTLNFRFGYDDTCPYGRGYCDMKCGPSEYTNCNMDAPVEYLQQTFEQVNTAIDDECTKKNINLQDFHYDATVQLACNSAKTQEEHQQFVHSGFLEIKNGKGYDVSINNEGEMDPFINVLQEIFYTCGYICTENKIFIDIPFDPNGTPEEQRKSIMDMLNILQSHLETGKYLEIKKLLINKNYPVKSMVLELLSQMVLSSGNKLADKIRLLEDFSPSSYSCDDHNHVIEILIQIRRGYMDLNTIFAIQRANQGLRPKEQKSQWTLDKFLLEALIAQYSQSDAFVY